jgi:hypothetical protein
MGINIMDIAILVCTILSLIINTWLLIEFLISTYNKRVEAEVKETITYIQGTRPGPKSVWGSRWKEMQESDKRNDIIRDIIQIKEGCGGGWFYFWDEGKTVCRCSFYGNEPHYFNWFNNKWVWIREFSLGELMQAYRRRLTDDERVKQIQKEKDIILNIKK